MGRFAVHTCCVRRPWARSIVAAAVALGVPGIGASLSPAVSSTNPPAATGDSQGDSDSHRPGPLILDEPLEPLVPKTARTEAEEDHLEALSLFAAARTHELRQEYAQAVRLYQRAFRRDPQAVTIARAIIPLALRLHRNTEAVRYALKMVEMEDADPALLRQLGIYVTEQGNWSQAVALYEKALAARKDVKESAADILLRMELGRLYHLLKQYGKAADCFARVSYAMEHPNEFGLDDEVQKALSTDSGLTLNLFGESCLLADRTDEAKAYFEKANQTSPNEGLLHYNLARVRAKKGEAAVALEELEACFAKHLDSEGVGPYELLASVLQDLGRKEELTGRLEALARDDPKNVPLGYSLAGQYLQTQQFDKAEPLYVALLEKSPTLTGYRSLVEIYHKTGRPDRLLATVGEALEKAGGLEALAAQGEAVVGDADFMRTMIEFAREKHRSEPASLSCGTCYAAAALALEGKQFETAAEFFNLALEADPKQAPELLLYWGMGLLLEDRTTEAVAVFRRAIDLKALPEDNPAFYFYLAGALAVDGQTDQALVAARKAAELKPDSPRFLSRVAWVLYRGKRNDEAIAAYRQLIDKFDSDDPTSETRDVVREARLALSALYVEKQQLAEAEEWLEQVLDEFPDDVGASNDLGYLWADQGKHLQHALKMIQTAVDAEPDNTAYRDSLGWVFFRLKQYPQAVEQLEKAVGDEGPPEAMILDHLGDAYAKAGQAEKAKDAWRRAAEAFRKDNQAEKAAEVEKKTRD